LARFRAFWRIVERIGSSSSSLRPPLWAEGGDPMTDTGRKRFHAAVLATACALGVALAVTEAPGNPIETTKPECASAIGKRELEALPAQGRQFANLALLAPGVKTTTMGDSKGRPKSVQVDAGTNQWNLPVSRWDKLNCALTAKKNNLRLEGGYTANLTYEWIAKPERVYFRFSNLKLGKERFPDQVLPYSLSGRYTLPEPPNEQPPGGNTWDKPMPPVPTDVVFRGPGDVVIPNGTLFDFNMSVLPHGENHDAHAVVFRGMKYFLCLEGPGQTQGRATNVNHDRFDIEKTLAPRPGFEWGPFTCDPTGCKGEGKFHGQPIRAWTPKLPVFSVPERTVKGNLDIELNNSRVPFQFTGLYQF
jgi:hypothetical protein